MVAPAQEMLGWVTPVTWREAELAVMLLEEAERTEGGCREVLQWRKGLGRWGGVPSLVLCSSCPG